MLRWRNRVLAGLVLVLLVMFCDWRYFRNFSTQEAMDSAQVARNISEGNGYTTLFVRPFSMYLIQNVNQKKSPPASADEKPDYARINGMHPDVSNPPVYPVVLAGWMKFYHGFNKVFNAVRGVMPGFIKGHLPTLNESLTNPIWMSDGKFSWNPGDFYIGVFNQILFFSIILLTFFWAKKHFDTRVAWMSGVLLFCSESLWQFTLSGLSTMLLALIFISLAWCLTLFDREMREPKMQGSGIFLLAGAIGLLTGLGGMTRYGFLFVIIPVVAFIMIFGGQRRVVLALIAVGVFAVVTTPWIVRNIKLTGQPFGTSSYTAMEGNGLPGYSAYQLQRSLHPNPQTSITAIAQKLLANIKTILQTDLPTLGGNWVTSLFLAGLLIGFRNLAIRRIRYFVLMCLGLFVLVQAGSRTQLSEDSPGLNSENYLILLFPLVTVYGASLFFVFLDQMTLPVRQLRYAVVTLFGIVTCLPFLISMTACVTLILPFIRLLPSRPGPESYPYKPGLIQTFSAFMKPDELIMSDMPWAVAWYGHRQSIWLTRDAQSSFPQKDDPHWEDYSETVKDKLLTEANYPDFLYVNDFQKHISAVYLTPLTTDRRFLSEWIMAGDRSWANFALGVLTSRRIPGGFPLTKTMDVEGMMPMQIFLTDWERWR